MSTDHSPRTVMAPKFISLAAVLAVIVGAMVLAGWVFDIAVLKSISPDWFPMKANFATGLILIGIALLLTVRPLATFNTQRAVFFSRLARFCVLLAGLIGALTLCEYTFGWNLGIDQWLFREPAGAVGTSHPGRMAQEAALCLALLATALSITGGSRKARWAMLAPVSLGLLVAALALVSVLSHLTPGLGAYGWFGLSIMALHASMMLAILGVAVIAISWRPDVLQWSLGGYTTAAFACGMVALVFIGFNTSRAQFLMKETNRKIAYNEEVLTNIRNLMIEVIDAQAHTRGYVITGDERFKTHYLEAKANSEVRLDALRKLIAANPHQQRQLALIEAGVNAELQWFQQVVDATGTGMINAARNKMVVHGEELLDNFRSTFERIKSDNRQVVEQLRRESESVSRFSYITIFIGTFTSLLIFLIVIFGLNSAVNERKKAEAELKRLNKTLLTLSNCNQALVRATDEQQLMNDVCRIFTEAGGYRMAWIGLAEHDAEKTVRPAAYSGHNEGYVEALNITWANTEQGQSPIGAAIRAGKPVVVRNIPTDAHFLPGGGGGAMEAMKRGYASMAALPLTDGETVIGSLNIYSDKADAFDADEMRLLMELAGDLSFGMRHQRIKEGLEASEKQFKGFADNALVGIVQSTLDGKMIYANNSLMKMFEYDSLEEFISAGALQRWKNPEDRKKMVETLKSSGKASFEAEQLTKTGKAITVVYSAVVSDDTISATTLDVTGRKRLEMALQAEGDRLKDAQHIGKLGFLDWDLVTNEIECSDETLRIYGLDTGKKKLKSEEITKLVHPDDVDLAVKSLNNAIEKGAEHHVEHRIVRPDGTIIYVDTRVEIIRDANGKPIRMLGTNLDITERKRVEKELRSANEELKTAATNMEKTHALMLRQEKLASIGTLSAGVAHEILNPLNIIGTIVQLMQMDEWPEKTKENLGEIMAQIRRATKITNNLRMFAHVHKREITPVDVHALFDKTAALIEYDLNLDNIMVDRDYDSNLPLILADQDLLAQVFLNLLNNARHALQEVRDRKKSISIKTGAAAGTVEIRLSNNGPRIPEDIIGKIFDPFFTTKDPNKGTGLGLSMAHAFIQDFGGTITVQNEAPEGVTFIITLPAKGKE